MPNFGVIARVLIKSTKRAASRLTPVRCDESSPCGAELKLIAHVATAEAAEAACGSGADAIYFDGDHLTRQSPGADAAWIRSFAKRMAGRHVRVGVLGPRICDERDIGEWRWALQELAGASDLSIGVSNLGALQVAQDVGAADILADFSFNVTNSAAADELSTLGARRITASVELSLEEILHLASTTRMPVEVIAQCPMPGMILED